MPTNAITNTPITGWILSATGFVLSCSAGRVTLQVQSVSSDQLWTYDPSAKTLQNGGGFLSSEPTGALSIVPSTTASTAAMQWTFNDNLSVTNGDGMCIAVPASPAAGTAVGVVPSSPKTSVCQQWKTLILPPPPPKSKNEFLKFKDSDQFTIMNVSTGLVIGTSPTEDGPRNGVFYARMQPLDGNRNQVWRFERSTGRLINGSGNVLGYYPLTNAGVFVFTPRVGPYEPDPCNSWIWNQGVIWLAASFSTPQHTGDCLLQGDPLISLQNYNPLEGKQFWAVNTFLPNEPALGLRSESSEFGKPVGNAIINAPAPPSGGLKPNEIYAAIASFGPIVRFHPREQYNMCSIEYFLQNSSLHDALNPSADVSAPKAWNLPKAPAIKDPNNDKQGRYWFIVKEVAKAGNLPSAKAYVRVVNAPGTTYTDIQYWLFYAYNGPGTAQVSRLTWFGYENTDVDLSPIGEHFGDWEMCMTRIDNSSKALIGVYLSQHNGGQYFDQKQIANGEVERGGSNGTQIVVYSSLNGHALYNAVGDNKSNDYSFGLGSFQLQNYCADGGSSLDCAQFHTIVSGPVPTIMPVPDPNAWVDYPYRWGPEGADTKITPATIQELLNGAGLGYLFPLGSIVLQQILSYFINDDLNGPSGPKQKRAWNGDYSPG